MKKSSYTGSYKGREAKGQILMQVRVDYKRLAEIALLFDLTGKPSTRGSLNGLFTEVLIYTQEMIRKEAGKYKEFDGEEAKAYLESKGYKLNERDFTYDE